MSAYRVTGKDKMVRRKPLSLVQRVCYFCNTGLDYVGKDPLVKSLDPRLVEVGRWECPKCSRRYSDACDLVTARKIGISQKKKENQASDLASSEPNG